MRLSWMAVLVLLAGCSGTTRVVRLDTEQGQPLVHITSGGQEPVKLREDVLRKSLADVARDVRPDSRPVRFARALMFESWQEEVYLEWTGQQLVLASPEGPRRHPAQDALTHGYGRWCEHQGRFRDCLSLLKDTPTLDADGRYTLAMAIAVDAVWNETKSTWAEMADPEAVRAAIVSAMAMYMMLWVLPEPASKGLAAILTAGLIAYLGVDTVWGLIGGWRQLVVEVNRATSFEQLREAGARYGKVMGKHAARAFLLLATAAIGNTAGLATKGPGLPGYSQAAVLAETQGGFRLAAVGQVRSVAVSAEGTFTIALAPGALAMSASAPDPGKPSSGKTSVYLSKNEADGEVQYVGITNHLARRAAYHLKTKGFDVKSLMDDLSREDARAVEQALIEIHGLSKNGGTLMNRINSIARSNPAYAALLRRGQELLESIGYRGQ